MVGGCFVRLRIVGRFQVSYTICRGGFQIKCNIKIVNIFLVSFDGDFQAVVAECLTNVFLNILNLSRRFIKCCKAVISVQTDVVPYSVANFDSR